MKQLFLFLLIGLPWWSSGQTNSALNLTLPQRQALDRAMSLAFPDEKTQGTDWLNLDVYAAAMDALGAVVDEGVLAQAQRGEGESLEAKFIVLAWEKRTHPKRLSAVYDEFLKYTPDARLHSGEVDSPPVTKDKGKWITPDYRLTWEYYFAMPVRFSRNLSYSKAPEALGRNMDARSLILYLPVARRAAAGKVGIAHRVRGDSGMLPFYLRSALEYRTAPALRIAVKIMYMRYTNPAVSEEFEGDANFSRASGYKRAWIREKEIKDWKPIARQVSREGLTAEENGFLDWVLAQPD